MRRRDLIKAIVVLSAILPAAGALAARAEQAAMPVVGFLNAQTARDYQRQLAAFLEGLADGGYVDGRNVKIEYRWAENHIDRLPAMMANLIERKVTAIAATSTPAALAAKAANTSIPIVFEIGFDPVRLGLVSNLNKDGGNITGITQLNALATPKRVELLHELVPAMKVMALLVNPANPVLMETEINEAQSAARSLGIELHVVNASQEGDFEGAYAKLKPLGAEGLVIGADPLFTSRSELLGVLAARHAVPAVFENRSFIAGGGLVSYGGNPLDSYRLTGIYVARILKGEKPSDLPVQQGTKLELLINAKAAKTLGITVSLPLSGRADEVIE
jgi:putative tryptophan/tyrosine transport system substrate-binding protein